MSADTPDTQSGDLGTHYRNTVELTMHNRNQYARTARGWVTTALLIMATGFVGAPAAPAQASDGPSLGLAPRPSATAVRPDTATTASWQTPLAASASWETVDIQNRQSVIDFFTAQHEVDARVELGWTGSVNGCNAGTVSAAARASVARRINFFRAMAGVPSSVSLLDSYNAKAQQSALMMSANDALSHTPPTSWRCYTPEGAQAAGSGNLAIGAAGASAINLYMHDFGDGNTAAGHRRWILYPQTRNMGTGDVAGGSGRWAANTLWVFDENLWATRPATREPFVAWPPPGYVPFGVVYPRWSFSLAGADFEGASVSVTSNGASLPVQLEPIQNGFGENTLVFLVNGIRHDAAWPRPLTDTVYAVDVRGVRVAGAMRDFSYQVTVVDPAPPQTGLSLTANEVAENLMAGAPAGLISLGGRDDMQYALVPGPGDTHNAEFEIRGNALLTRLSLDFETAALRSVRIRAVDGQGSTIEAQLSVRVLNVDEAPVLSINTVALDGDQLNLTVNVKDPEGAVPQIQVLSAPVWITVQVRGDQIQMTGDARRGAAVSNPVRFRLSDPRGNTADTVLNVVVASHRVLLPLTQR
jgi:Cysteine-rich secretory protein family